MSNNPAKYEVLNKQYLCLILDISEFKLMWLIWNVRQLAPGTMRPRSSDSVVDKRTKNNLFGGG